MKTILMGAVVILSMIAGTVLAQDPVVFTDPILKRIIEDELWVSDPTPTDMLGLIELRFVDKGVTGLCGLEYASNLQKLMMRLNSITDISALSGLTQLQYLDQSQNKIKDLSPVSFLRNLRHLDTHENDVSDLSPLSGLVKLETLILRETKVRDISALSPLSNLRTLVLTSNRIDDISAVAGMSRLGTLTLLNCRVSDITALEGLSKLGDLNLQDNFVKDISALVGQRNLYRLNLLGNPLNESAYSSHLQLIQDQNPGLTLLYDPNPSPVTSVSVTNRSFENRVTITWQALDNGPDYTSYYRVFRSLSATTVKEPISAWLPCLTFEDTVASGTTYSYFIQAATSAQGLNAGVYSDFDTSQLWPESLLTVLSTVGGSVSLPREGEHPVSTGDSISVYAESDDPDLFVFSHWTGSAVDAGQMGDPNAASTEVTVGSNYTLKAHFVSVLDTLYVDTHHTSCIEGHGTPEQPFNRIQDAIDVGAEGVCIRVASGTYHESLDFLGKNLQLMGFDPNASDEIAYPVIEGNNLDPIVSFVNGENRSCVLDGFVLTRGFGAILCVDASPTITHCVMAGNGLLNPNLESAAVTVTNGSVALGHCTITDNIRGIMLLDSDIQVDNSIVWGNELADIGVSGTSLPVFNYSNVQGGWPGQGLIDADPQFVQPGFYISVEDSDWVYGDYHLKSYAGRWNAPLGAWVTDDVMSPCIDGGDPGTGVGLEPQPHGGLLNMGAYGGTQAASKSNGQ